MYKVKVHGSKVGYLKRGFGFCNFAFQGDGILEWGEKYLEISRSGKNYSDTPLRRHNEVYC